MRLHYAADFVFLRAVWLRTQRAAVPSRRATTLATHVPILATQLLIYYIFASQHFAFRISQKETRILMPIRFRLSILMPIQIRILSQVLHLLENQNFSCLFTAVHPVCIVNSFSSLSETKIHILDSTVPYVEIFLKKVYSTVVLLYIWLKWIRIRIRQNDADLTGTGYTTLTETNIKRTLAGAKP